MHPQILDPRTCTLPQIRSCTCTSPSGHARSGQHAQTCTCTLTMTCYPDHVCPPGHLASIPRCSRSACMFYLISLVYMWLWSWKTQSGVFLFVYSFKQNASSPQLEWLLVLAKLHSWVIVWQPCAIVPDALWHIFSRLHSPLLGKYTCTIQ